MAPATVTVLSQSHLDAIRAKVAPSSVRAAEQEQLQLKKLSDERAAGWPDTLQAKNRQRDAARKERLAAEEAVRQELDKQEAELREDKRKRQAAEAEAALWEQGSMARAVRSQLLLSDVLAERETQIAERAYVAGIAAAQDGQYLAQLHETMQAAEEVEKLNEEERRVRSEREKAALLDQLEELKQAIIAERELRRLEGQRLVEEAKAAEQAAHEQAARVRARAVKAVEDTKVANALLQQLKAEQQRRDAEQDERIRAYGVQQEARQQALAAQQAQRAAEVAARRAIVIAAAERAHIAMHEADAARLSRDIAELQDTAARDQARSEAKRLHMREELDRSWQEQLASKAQARLAATQAARDAAQILGEHLATLKALDAEEATRVKQQHQQHVDFLRHQIERKQAQAAAHERELDQENAARLWAQREMEDQLRARADLRVAEWAQAGKPLGPLGRPLKAAIKQSLA